MPDSTRHRFRDWSNELRNIHDWDNPLRPYIDGLEFVVLICMTVFSFFYALGPAYTGADGEFHSVYSLFGLVTHWRLFMRLIAGLLVSLTGGLLLRDFFYGAGERAEERQRRKEWQEYREQLAKIDAENKDTGALHGA